MSLPTSPPSNVRLARLADLDRISVVAAASFYHSPIFQYKTPFFSGNATDTLAGERDKFREAILDPKRAAIVIEGELDPDESLRTYQSLRKLYPTLSGDFVPSGSKGHRGIVGVAAFRLPDGAKSIGTFMPEG